ncbi:MAG: terpene cyclase/mutase family protein [Planctomycetes bacterium]|nr:terpene cyclase/mutase family protein [Planctomycetota bacterium]
MKTNDNNTNKISNGVKRRNNNLIIILIVAWFLPMLLSPARGEDKKMQPDKNRVNSAIEKGLDYLARTQNPNGSWTCTVGYKLNDTYDGEQKENVGVTAIAGIAFLAQGSVPGKGKYGTNVEKAVQFVLSCARETDGYITKHGTRMYEHGFATLFLAEVYGMTKREDIKSRLKKSAQLIINSQDSKGGWRYQPYPHDSDISVTVTTLQALRACRNVGIAVPKEVIDKAVSYVKKSYVALPGSTGAFNYQLIPPSRISFALTAAGVTSLMSAGEYNIPEVQNGINHILKNLPTIYGDYHYYYGHYYSVQALFQAGGKNWEPYFSRIRNEIIIHQEQDGSGSWTDEVGPVYATAMACIILQIPNDYLPIFQR